MQERFDQLIKFKLIRLTNITSEKEDNPLRSGSLNYQTYEWTHSMLGEYLYASYLAEKWGGNQNEATKGIDQLLRTQHRNDSNESQTSNIRESGKLAQLDRDTYGYIFQFLAGCMSDPSPLFQRLCTPVVSTRLRGADTLDLLALCELPSNVNDIVNHKEIWQFLCEKYIRSTSPNRRGGEINEQWMTVQLIEMTKKPSKDGCDCLRRFIELWDACRNQKIWQEMMEESAKILWTKNRLQAEIIIKLLTELIVSVTDEEEIKIFRKFRNRVSDSDDKLLLMIRLSDIALQVDNTSKVSLLNFVQMWNKYRNDSQWQAAMTDIAAILWKNKTVDAIKITKRLNDLIEETDDLAQKEMLKRFQNGVFKIPSPWQQVVESLMIRCLSEIVAQLPENNPERLLFEFVKIYDKHKDNSWKSMISADAKNMQKTNNQLKIKTEKLLKDLIDKTADRTQKEMLENFRDQVFLFSKRAELHEKL